MCKDPGHTWRGQGGGLPCSSRMSNTYSSLLDPDVLMQAGSQSLPQLEAGKLRPGETKRDPHKNVDKRYLLAFTAQASCFH